ncbi:hypothetical protein EMIT0P218_20118 [Pseudomonas sp. IT-P218]
MKSVPFSSLIVGLHESHRMIDYRYNQKIVMDTSRHASFPLQNPGGCICRRDPRRAFAARYASADSPPVGC